MNDNHYKLDTTFRATDGRNKRVVEWVSVKDRLPELMQDVLFLFIRDRAQKEFCLGHRDEDGWNSCLLFNSHKLINDKDIIDVTHWASLEGIEPHDI